MSDIDLFTVGDPASREAIPAQTSANDMVLIFCRRSYFFRLQSPNQALVCIFTSDFCRWAIFSFIHNHLGFTLSCLTHTEQVNQIHTSDWSVVTTILSHYAISAGPETNWYLLVRRQQAFKQHRWTVHPQTTKDGAHNRLLVTKQEDWDRCPRL